MLSFGLFAVGGHKMLLSKRVKGRNAGGLNRSTVTRCNFV